MTDNKSIFDLSWPEYYKKITNEMLHGHTNIYKRRVAIISTAGKLFKKNKKFCDMNEEERKFIAGMKNNITEEIFQSFEHIEGENTGWFGNMRGAGYYTHEVIINNKELSLALDAIPISGKISKQHFLDFWEIFEKIFTRNFVAPPTRLLCMKRPDIFICLNSANIKNIKKTFSIKKSKIDKHFYWDEIIERIFACNWWKNPMPNKDSTDEIVISSARAAFLDSLVYNRTIKG